MDFFLFCRYVGVNDERVMWDVSVFDISVIFLGEMQHQSGATW
jgi:hypothetical protein